MSVDPNLLQVIVPRATMRSAASYGAEPVNELLYGERVRCLADNSHDFIHVRSDHDGYEGFIEISSLGQVVIPSHRINVPLTHVYETPDFKTSPLQPLYFSSQIAVGPEREDGFAALTEGGWVFESHLNQTDKKAEEHTEIALLFKNTPYAWGGRSAAGIDCSGLVQIALMAAGIKCPRDTKDQIESLGGDIKIKRARFERGDIVFFKRHVGIMIDEKRLLNATSRHMKAVIEDIDAVSDAYGGILAIKRLTQDD